MNNVLCYAMLCYAAVRLTVLGSFFSAYNMLKKGRFSFTFKLAFVIIKYCLCCTLYINVN